MLNALALLYHTHHSRHAEDLPLWLELAACQGDPILELGCGTGRVLLPLAQSGRRIVGLDLNAAMLAYLKNSLQPAAASRVSLLQADMVKFNLALRFALVIIPCNTFSMLSAAQRRSALGCILQHLQPGGLLAISLPNPAFLQNLPRRSRAEVEEHFPHPLDGEPVQVSSAWERSARHLTLTWHYDHLLPDGRVQRLSMQARHELASLEIYQEELQAAGLRFSAAFGDYDQSPLSPTSPLLILLANRP